MNPEQLNQLEMLVAENNLSGVLAALAEICRLKSCHASLPPADYLAVHALERARERLTILAGTKTILDCDVLGGGRR